MAAGRLDFSLFDKFNFEYRPVGVKFTLKKPADVAPLSKGLAICEMFKEAQTSEPFYATKETTQCGEHVVGYEEFPTLMYSGQLGPHFSMFRTALANRRVYDYIRLLPKDSAKYIIHASYDKMTFDPDLIIFTANTRQAEILMRASTFASGDMWSMKGSTCLACAWLYSYPYMTGELNFSISGLGFSMKARNVLPDGLILISVPANQLPILMDNLNEMEWEPEWFKLGREGFIQAVKKLDEQIIADYGMTDRWK
jgi:uncharacterized protein (DUF169 family)